MLLNFPSHGEEMHRLNKSNHALLCRGCSESDRKDKNFFVKHQMSRK